MLFYDARTGKGATGFLSEDGLFETWQQFPDPDEGNPSFSVGWSHVVNVNDKVLFYDAASGKGAVGEIDDEGNFSTLQNYPDPATGHAAFALGWTHIVNCLDGLIFFYASPTGAGATVSIDEDGSIQTLQHFPDSSNQLPAFSTGWSHVLAGCNGVLLFYRSDNGQSSTGGLNFEGEFTELQQYAPWSFNQSWTHIVAAKT
jgi:hypothetical protein